MNLTVIIPGNPWQGRINARDRAAVTRDGVPYNRKRPGFKAYQASVAEWCRQAVEAQGWLRLYGPAEVWMVLRAPDRRRRDLDGPIKAILDGLTQGGAWADDSQVARLTVDKRLGEPGATVRIRPWVDGSAGSVLPRLR